MSFITELTSLSPVRIREKINAIIAELRKLKLTAGKGIRLDEHASGTIISALGGGGGAGRSVAELTGPFDVKIDNGSVIVYNSALSGSNVAGYVKIGSHNYSIQKTTVTVSTGTLYLNAVYTTNSDISFTFQIGQYPQTDSRQQYTLRMAEITNDGTQYNISRTRLPGDIEILGRWFE